MILNNSTRNRPWDMIWLPPGAGFLMLYHDFIQIMTLFLHAVFSTFVHTGRTFSATRRLYKRCERTEWHKHAHIPQYRLVTIPKAYAPQLNVVSLRRQLVTRHHWLVQQLDDTLPCLLSSIGRYLFQCTYFISFIKFLKFSTISFDLVWCK